MDTVLNWIVTHYGVVSAGATIVIAVFAGITAWLTRSVVRENKLLRKVGEEPRIIAYLASDARHATQINLVLMNVGRGPARSVDYHLKIEDRFFGNGLVAPLNKPERKPFGFLPQDEKIRMLFGSGPGLLGEDKLPPFEARVTWENLHGKKFEEVYNLDVCQFLGFFLPSVPPEHEIAESLKKISKRFGSIVTTSSPTRLKVETIAPEDKGAQSKQGRKSNNDENDNSHIETKESK